MSYSMNNGNNTGRPAAAEVARISTNHAYVLVASEKSDGIVVFANGNVIPNGSLESLSLNISVPTETNSAPIVTGILSYYDESTDGTRATRTVSLFPGTIELIALGRRISVTAQEAGSLEGLWLGVGMNVDGTSNEVHGVRSLRVLITPDITDAQLTWDEDGTTENIFEASAPSMVQPGGNPPASGKGGLFTAFG